MSFEGTVINGTIVLDAGETLPEGERVRVDLRPTMTRISTKRLWKRNPDAKI